MTGFKSFADKVTIPFPEGFNTICGPNGAGKSNVVDAITFVLGTVSAKSIRAQKLQNLIFNGGKSRKPAEFCEVTLYLDNSDGKIPNYEKEVKLTRRITRSGISVYKLNGKTETRSKILDLMANANLSPEGYNIIMQGDVTKIIEMGPVERRGVIDEISGIAEFDEKKAKATMELEKVESRVRENMIVIAEKQRLVSRLKQEKENAEKYDKLNRDLRKAKASLVNKRLRESQEKMVLFDKEIGEGTEKFDALEKDFTSVEKELEEKEKSVEAVSEEIIKKSSNYEIMRKIDAIQTEILRKQDKIDMNEREIQRLLATTDNTVREVLNLGKGGVYGTVSSLVSMPEKYSIALEVAIGRHANDVVVDSDATAAECINFLKERKIGRARFLPLNKIHGKKKEKCSGDIIGYAIDLVKFEKKYEPALEYVLGSTLVVDNIGKARKIPRFRIATLDGDLVEISGAMIGGFYKKVHRSSLSGVNAIRQENEKIASEISEMGKELEELRGQEKAETEEVKSLHAEKKTVDTHLEELKKRRKTLFEERLILQGNISKLKIEKARLEAGMDNLKIEFQEFPDVKEFFSLSVEELQEKTRSCMIEINKLGLINMKAIEDYKTISVEFEEIKKKLDKLLEEKESITRVVQEVEKKRYDKFMETITDISDNFSRIYQDLGGFGKLRLEEEDNIDSGLVVEASPQGKNILNLDSMSGGEKTLTSLAFLFAIMEHYSSPFYILDEVDAALDKANTKKIVDLAKKYSKDKQFIIISHNDFTIQESDKVFGVSVEDGVSKVFGIELPKG